MFTFLDYQQRNTVEIGNYFDSGLIVEVICLAKALNILWCYPLKSEGLMLFSILNYSNYFFIFGFWTAGQ